MRACVRMCVRACVCARIAVYMGLLQNIYNSLHQLCAVTFSNKKLVIML